MIRRYNKETQLFDDFCNSHCFQSQKPFGLVEFKERFKLFLDLKNGEKIFIKTDVFDRKYNNKFSVDNNLIFCEFSRKSGALNSYIRDFFNVNKINYLEDVDGIDFVFEYRSLGFVRNYYIKITDNCDKWIESEEYNNIRNEYCMHLNTKTTLDEFCSIFSKITGKFNFTKFYRSREYTINDDPNGFC